MSLLSTLPRLFQKIIVVCPEWHLLKENGLKYQAVEFWVAEVLIGYGLFSETARLSPRPTGNDRSVFYGSKSRSSSIGNSMSNNKLNPPNA